MKVLEREMSVNAKKKLQASERKKEFWQKEDEYLQEIQELEALIQKS